MVRPPCTRFEANPFNRAKCSNCFQPKTEHSAETLERLKMNRKLTAHGWLYVAPSNIDFSQQAHSAKRWQRRYFALYDTGQLTYSLDNNPDTIPQVSMDMAACTRVCEADSITGHAHSILVAFDGHVCYVKADTTDEIRQWQAMLLVHVKQNLQHMRPRRRSPSDCDTTKTSSFESQEDSSLDEKDILRSNCSSPSSSSTAAGDGSDEEEEDEEEEEVREYIQPPLVSRPTELASAPSYTLGHSLPASSSSTGRDSSGSTGGGREESALTSSASTIMPSSLPAPPPSSTLMPATTRARMPFNTPFHIDTAPVQTLRKGWLMLRGKSDREWSKHWVVLAGLSLKLYKDVWAEDSTEPVVTIDLSECENVYPSASAKNYGIEMKCRQKRYVLSALTPGIRDSWIDALKHNLHNPSPSYVESAGGGVNSNDALSIPDSHSDILRRKKHIAYVAPESHHSNSMLSEESLSEEDVVDGISKQGDSLPRSCSSGHRARRDTSPAVRSSPMSRIKERSAEGRARNASGSSSVASSSHRSSTTKSLKKMRSAPASSGPDLTATISGLELQVRSLREQLNDTRSRLEDTERERERRRNGNDPSLEALRRSLAAAEKDIREKQTEYAELQRRLDEQAAEPSPDRKLLTSFRSRLVSMLKVQLGVLSKCLETRSLIGAKHECAEHLEELTAALNRLDWLAEGEDDLESLYDLLEDVTVLYDRVSQRLRVPVVAESGVNTEECPEFIEYDYTKSDREWAAELMAVQNTHESELESLRNHYEHQLRQLHEKESLQRRHSGEEKVDTASSVRATYEEMLEDAKKSYEEDVEAIKREHKCELEEEKRATRVALEAVRRAHEEELRTLAEKAGRNDPTSSRQAIRVAESLREELSSLTALYHEKCDESEELTARLAEMQGEAERAGEDRSRMVDEAAARESQLAELRDQIARLEERLDQPGTPEAPPTSTADPHATLTAASGAPPSVATSSPAPAGAVRFRRVPPKRDRRDVRFHSNPSIPVSFAPPPLPSTSIPSWNPSSCAAELAHLPVAERRKFFETIAEYNTPF